MVFLNTRGVLSISAIEKEDMKKFIKQDIEAVWNSKTFVSAGLSFKICFDITVYYDDDAHPTPEDPAYNEFIFEIASSGKRSYVKNQRDNYFDTSILPSHSILHKENFDPLKDTDKHTPAHEFGHLYGLADRYHYYQRIMSYQVVPLRSYKGTQNWRYVYGDIPMALPKGGNDPIYDKDYTWDENLYSAGKLEITQFQLHIVLYYYLTCLSANKYLITSKIKDESEVIPVSQMTIFGNSDPDLGTGTYFMAFCVAEKLSGFNEYRMILKYELEKYSTSIKLIKYYKDKRGLVIGISKDKRIEILGSGIGFRTTKNGENAEIPLGWGDENGLKYYNHKNNDISIFAIPYDQDITIKDDNKFWKK